jgi:hypothetical protein
MLYVLGIETVFIRFMINQAEIDNNTQTKDQIIQFFAFFVVSSFQAEVKYIIPEIIVEITAITAIYFIRVAIKDGINLETTSHPELQAPGRPAQFITGARAKA